MKKGITILGILVSIGLLAILPIACGGGSSGGDDGGGGGGGGGNTPEQTLDQDNVDSTLDTLDSTIPFCAMNSAAPNSGAALRSVLNLGQDVMKQVKVVYEDPSEMVIQVDQSPPPISGNCPVNPGQLDIVLDRHLELN